MIFIFSVGFNPSPAVQLCPVENQEYLQSGKTCKSLENGDQTSEPGCHCKDGLYWNNITEKCVVKTECGCVHEGKYFEKGATSPISCSLWVYHYLMWSVNQLVGVVGDLMYRILHHPESCSIKYFRPHAIGLNATRDRIFPSKNWAISEHIPQFSKRPSVAKNICRLVNTVAFI